MRLVRVVILCLGLVPFSFESYAQQIWYPFPVDIWEPALSGSASVVQGDYTPLERASQPWSICVSIPHLKDPWWVALNYGLVSEAKRLGVRINMYEAGGYENTETQIRQVLECLEAKPDGILLSAVDLDKLNPIVEQIFNLGIPVTDYINGISSEKVAARTVRPYSDLATQAGEFMIDLLRDEQWDRPAKVAWFPGPSSAGWARSADVGMKDVVEGAPIEIVTTLWGDTGRTQQARLLEQALAENEDIDFIVGTAVTVESAVRILRERGLTDRVRIISYYFSPGVYREIQRGTVLGAPSDNPGIQGRIGLDQLVRIIEGEPVLRQVAAETDFVTPDSLEDFESYRAVAPIGFQPVFVVN